MTMRFAALALCAFTSMSAAAGSTTYVHVGRLLADPATGKVQRDQTLVIRDGRVDEVRNGFSVGQGEVIDLRNSFVLPGLIDSHVHLCHENGANDRLRRTVQSAANLAIDGVYFAGITLDAGFTTVVNLGDDDEAIFALRDGIEAGRIRGPRVIAAGTAVKPDGGAHGGYRADVMAAIAADDTCTGADGCRALVRRKINRGADIIKVVATGAVLSDARHGLGGQFTMEELTAIVDAAHMLGRKVTAHAHGAEGINAMLKAGGDAIEHGTFMDDESIRLFKETGAYLVPTLLASTTTAEWAADPNTWLSPQAQAKAVDAGKQILVMGRKAKQRNLKVAFGSDSSVSRHGQNAREFVLMTDVGFTPLEAIQAATVHGAAHLGMTGDLGSLTPGKYADLIAVTGNPLEDVSELRRVQFVMKAGQVYKTDTREARSGTD